MKNQEELDTKVYPIVKQNDQLEPVSPEVVQSKETGMVVHGWGIIKSMLFGSNSSVTSVSVRSFIPDF